MDHAEIPKASEANWARFGTPVIQSHVWHEGTCFFVSTTLIECSSPHGQWVFYYEHMATLLDESGPYSLGIVARSPNDCKAFEYHSDLCRQLSRTGKHVSKPLEG